MAPGSKPLVHMPQSRCSFQPRVRRKGLCADWSCVLDAPLPMTLTQKNVLTRIDEDASLIANFDASFQYTITPNEESVYKINRYN